MVQLLLLLAFLAVIGFQLYRINQIVVQEKKITGTYIVLILGIGMILAITFYFGEHWSRFLIGMIGATVLACSIYETGLTTDSFLYSAPGQRIISQRSRFVDTGNIRVEVFHEDKVVVRFIHKKAEHFMVFSKQDEQKIKDTLKHHIASIVFE